MFSHKLVVLLLIVAAAPALAQESPEIRRAHQLFDEGTTLFADEAFARAETSWREAHRIMSAGNHPNAALVLVNVARAVESQPGREAEALQLYERVLRETQGDNRDNVVEARRIATQRAAEARARMANRGGFTDLQWVGLGTGIGGGVALLASLAFGIPALMIHDDLAAACMNGACPPERSGDIAAGSALGWTSTILLFAGAAAAALGVTLFIVGMPSAAATQTASLRISWLGPAFSLQGSF